MASPVLAIALAAVLASGAEAPRPAEVTQEAGAGARLAAEVAREVLPEERWNRTVEDLVPQLAERIRSLAAEQGGTVDAGLERAIRALYHEVAPYEAVVALEAGLLRKRFTAEELAELRAFYRTPLGRKVRDRMSAVTEEALTATVARLRDGDGKLARLKAFIHLPAAPIEAPTPAAKL